MIQYCIYTRDEKFLEVAMYITRHKMECEVHLNRTRFWVPLEMHETFLREYGHICTYVHDDEDLATGLRL